VGDGERLARLEGDGGANVHGVCSLKYFAAR
jgi:hypothetical protein